MKCVLLQPSYIPWRGHFHQMQKADRFVFYDDVQYDKHGWRNRNKIKTPQGLKWLTIPVLSKGNSTEHIPIKEIEIDWKHPWPHKHWESIRQCYGKAPFFKKYAPVLEPYYKQKPVLLADFTIETTIAIAELLGLERSKFIRSSSLVASGAKTDRILEVLKQIGATHYISGPAAKEYLDEKKLNDSGISVEWMSYNYPEYEQFYPPYDPGVTILDLLFMKGPDAPKFIWS
jgi:hypothetical protein